MPKRTAPPAREHQARLQPQAVLGTFCLFFSPADWNSIFLQAGRLFCIVTLCGLLSKELDCHCQLIARYRNLSKG